jgi:flagellar biosynthesis/type III secretory pathway protein FliH
MASLQGGRAMPPTSSSSPPFSAPNVLYIEDFDELFAVPEPPPQEPPEIIAPGYTAEDVETAREEGHAAGLDEARTEHAAIQAALCTACLAAIADGVSAARADAAAIATAAAADIAGAVLALLSACLPATAARLAPAEVTALLRALLPPLAREPGVSITVHPDLLSAITSHAAGFSDMTVAAGPSLAPSDVTVAWRDGEARRDWAAIWRDVTAALAPFPLPAELTALPPAGQGSNHAQ